MGFVITVPTAVPVNADGTLDQATWGEAGGPFSVPAEEGAGLGAVTLASNTVNYEWQHPARWLRSMMDRMALSDEGLLSSCVLKQGTWNIAGGTLDVTLTPSRVGVDAATAPGDGGVVLEIKAPVGSPETLLASRDTYLNLNEAGAFELQAVPNLDPPPVPTAGFVSIWVLVTDGTELTAANLADGIAPFPCLGPTIGIRAAVIEDLLVPGPVQLGDDAGDAITVVGTMTVAQEASFNTGIKGVGPTGPVTLTQGATLPAGEGLIGPVTSPITGGVITALGKVVSTGGGEGAGSTPFDLPEGATAPAGKTIQADALVGVESTTTKRVALTSEQASAGDRQIHHLGGELRYRDGDDNYIHNGGQPFASFAPGLPNFKNFGPLTTPTDGPTVSVTVVGIGLLVIHATADVTGTDVSTVARIKIIVNAVTEFDAVYSVPPGNTALVWSKTFRLLGPVGTYDAKIQFDRSAGIGNVNVAESTIVVVTG